MPYITKKHFEYAMRESRRSVSDADLLKYESFSQKMKQQRGSTGSGVANFSFGANGSTPAAPVQEDDMDGLYDEPTPAAAPAAPLLLQVLKMMMMTCTIKNCDVFVNKD